MQAAARVEPCSRTPGCPNTKGHCGRCKKNNQGAGGAGPSGPIPARNEPPAETAVPHASGRSANTDAAANALLGIATSLPQAPEPSNEDLENFKNCLAIDGPKNAFQRAYFQKELGVAKKRVKELENSVRKLKRRIAKGTEEREELNKRIEELFSFSRQPRQRGDDEDSS